MSVTTKATVASFGGKLLKLSHHAKTVGCDMAFNLYLPPQATASPPQKVPLLIYLSGLTCTPDNCSEKGFFQHGASKRGIAVLYPDTSPRGIDIQGQDDSYDFGSGAGFYVDATADPWSTNYKIYSYITTELPQIVSEAFSEQVDTSRVSITGHSMGGHGALTLFLKNPKKYKSCSAFAPIANPLQAPWGEKAFKGYFGSEGWKEKGKEHDATELIKQYKDDLDILIDVGTADNFYKDGQLLPENLLDAAKLAGVDSGLKIRFQDGYDHSYYLMASFADDHIDHAAQYLFA